MSGMKKTKEKVLEAVAVARDEALVKLGKDAEGRQGLRVASARGRKAGKVAMAAVLAGGAVAAGVLAVKAYKGKGVLEAAADKLN